MMVCSPGILVDFKRESLSEKKPHQVHLRGLCRGLQDSANPISMQEKAHDAGHKTSQLVRNQIKWESLEARSLESAFPFPVPESDILPLKRLQTRLGGHLGNADSRVLQRYKAID